MSYDAKRYSRPVIRSFRSRAAEEIWRGERARELRSINEQWRICFVWREGDVHEVEIVDYH